MRTTLNIDDEALEKAMATAPGETKTAVINRALQEFARRRRLRDLLRYEGRMDWTGNLDELRGRRPADD